MDYVRSHLSFKLLWLLSKPDVQTRCFSNILAFQEGSLLLCLSKPSSLVCYGFSLHHTSSSSTHICISLELFMLCFVFNTPSCKKARLPGIKQSKTPLPLKPVPPWLENLWPSHRPWDRSEEEAAWALAETRHPLVFDAPAHFVTLWTYSIPWGWCHWRVPFLSTCPVTWSYLFHLNFASSNIYPSLHFRICYPNQR